MYTTQEKAQIHDLVNFVWPPLRAHLARRATPEVVVCGAVYHLLAGVLRNVLARTPAVLREERCAELLARLEAHLLDELARLEEEEHEDG